MEKVAFSYVRMLKEFWIVNSYDRRSKKSHVGETIDYKSYSETL